MKKKVNPRRIPASMADVLKAKNDAVPVAISTAYIIMFSVLLDKHNAPVAELRTLWNEVEDLSDSITKGYVNVSDLRHTLKEEAGIEFD